MRSFRGGIHLEYAKESTERKRIIKMMPPEKAFILLQQHIGAPCEPLIAVGDEVKVGQKIGEAKAFVSAPVHSSLSGKVASIASVPDCRGGESTAIVIESDGKDEIWEGIIPYGDDLNLLSAEEIKRIVREAGIVGMGGAAFPTHVKLSPPSDKKIDSIILNGCECEPYLTADHRLMIERPEEVIFGLRAVMKALGVEQGYIGIEDNKVDAAERLKAVIGDDSSIKVVLLKVKYPQGSEKHLIDAILHRHVPSGGLPMDVGVVVNNAATAVACARAIKTGMPLIERVLTVAGPGVKEPCNLEVRIGTPFEDVIAECGGLLGSPTKIIMGGPMMGIAQYGLSAPVVKGTSGLLIFSQKEKGRIWTGPCIRCGKCVEVCPMSLIPLELSHLSEKGLFDEAEEYNILDCIECGACSYICPAKRQNLQLIRMGKAEIVAKRRNKLA